MGEEPTLISEHGPKYAGIRFIFNKEDLKVYEDLQKNQPQLIEYVSEIEEVGEHEVVDSSTRFGYFIIVSDSEQEVKEILER